MSDGDAQKLVDAVADATRTGMGQMSTALAWQVFLGLRARRHGAGQRRRLLPRAPRRAVAVVDQRGGCLVESGSA